MFIDRTRKVEDWTDTVLRRLIMIFYIFII